MTSDADIDAGDSKEQRDPEPEMLSVLGAQLGVTLVPKSLALGEGSRIDIDGVSEVPLVLCEVFAHLGRLRPGQTRKIITDAFKLVYAEKWMGAAARKIVLLSDNQAASPFKGRSWVARAFKELGIEVHVAPLSSASREKLRVAQTRQGQFGSKVKRDA